MNNILCYYKYTEKEIKELLKSIVVVVDRREQENLHIMQSFHKMKVETFNKSLSFGDYSFYLPANLDLGIIRDLWFHNEIVIERKNSLEELSTNLAKNRTSFENELIRGKKCKFILLIEKGNYNDVIKGNYDTRFGKEAYWSSLMTFQARYNVNIQFIEKEIAGKYIYSTFYYHLRELLIN